MNYYSQKNNNGYLNISEKVFDEIATDSLNALMQDDLKDVVFLKSGKKTARVHSEIDKKNHIKVDVELFLASDCQASSVSSDIQKAIYDDIYDATELSSVKVNVIILGFITKK